MSGGAQILPTHVVEALIARTTKAGILLQSSAETCTLDVVAALPVASDSNFLPAHAMPCSALKVSATAGTIAKEAAAASVELQLQV